MLHLAWLRIRMFTQANLRASAADDGGSDIGHYIFPPGADVDDFTSGQRHFQERA